MQSTQVFSAIVATSSFKKVKSMDYTALKVRLDDLYAQMNEPQGVVPEWAEPAMSGAEIKEQEARLGCQLPEEMSLALAAFSGISHDTPLYLGAAFKDLQKQVILQSGRELGKEDFQDDLEITVLYSPQEWRGEELQELRAIDAEGLGEVESHQQIAVEADMAWLNDERFILIGTTYSQSLYLNLMDVNSPHYGAVYNLVFPYPFAVLYKVADGYQDLFEKIEASLQRKLKSLG